MIADDLDYRYGGETITVLHVDDDPGFADLTAEFLERESDRHEVLVENDPREALDRLDGVDCIVSDYEMPEMDGIEFLEAVRERCRDVPFILLTGKGSEEIASEAISAGVTDYIRKGGGSDQYVLLSNRIENAVARYRAERAMQEAYRAIETAREGIAVLDEEGRFTYVNRAYAEMYGYARDDLLGEHWEVLYSDEDAEEARETILPEVHQQGTWRGVTLGRRSDGTTFREDHSLAVTESGGLVCVVRPLTDGEGELGSIGVLE